MTSETPTMGTPSGAKALAACPTCGAKLPETPFSLCPYCASPLESKADRDVRASVHATRIGRVAEHANFPGALEWIPPEGPRWIQGQRQVWWGTRGILAGALFGTLWLARAGMQGWANGPSSYLFGLAGQGLLVGLGVWAILRGRRSMRDSLSQPLLKRPALIIDRRSETFVRGWVGHTIYYFRIEFEGGAQGGILLSRSRGRTMTPTPITFPAWLTPGGKSSSASATSGSNHNPIWPALADASGPLDCALWAAPPRSRASWAWARRRMGTKKHPATAVPMGSEWRGALLKNPAITYFRAYALSSALPA